jgi:tripartite-type tricarboxylate transporter receptor subunit TctC
VPFSPGGTTDLLARVLGKQLSQNLGQPFVVDSKPGASGSIGSVEVARAPGDGYTLLLTTSSTHAVAPALSSQLRYNPVEDFTPIAHLADSQLVLLGSPTIDAKNGKELLALARQKPGQLNYSSSGVGTIAHLTTEALKSQAGVFITHIPYKGSGQAIPDLVNGAVHLTWDALASGLPHAKEGRVRALAVSGPKRSPLAPEIPTVAEAGVPGFSVLTWFGLYAPRGLPPALTQRINEEVNKVLRSPEMVERYVAWGIEARIGSPADFSAMVTKDAARWSKLVKDVNLKVN